ncbi:MAG: hypothetical protein L3K23_10375 [Thermoplasmata archaeon]|nr:hypothetical protein [Thermoplasmata archaeon]
MARTSQEADDPLAALRDEGLPWLLAVAVAFARGDLPGDRCPGCAGPLVGYDYHDPSVRACPALGCPFLSTTAGGIAA